MGVTGGRHVLLGKTEVPETGWYAIFQDTEGTTLAIWERAPGRGGLAGDKISS